MGEIYVARSASLSKWGSDVGLGKNLFKLGYALEEAAPLVAAGWAGESDWTLVKKQKAEDITEEEIIARLGRKEKMVDPKYYPKIRGALGIFKVDPAHVESHILVNRALAGEAERVAIKLKPADFAAYLLHNAMR